MSRTLHASTILLTPRKWFLPCPRSAFAAAMLVTCTSLAGCGTAQPGAIWWNPTTWWSASEAHALDRAELKATVAEDKTDKAREELLRSAQREAHKGGEALDAAIKALPATPELAAPRQALDLSFRFSGNSLRGLDQALGPVPAADAAADTALVLGLLSRETTRREAAEVRQTDAEKHLSAASRELEKARAALAAANASLANKTAALRTAFDRENALANTLRNQRFALWGLAGLSVVLGAAWLYLRIASGGVIKAIGTTLADLKTADSGTYKAAVAALDANLNRSEQAAINKAKCAAFGAAADNHMIP